MFTDVSLLSYIKVHQLYSPSRALQTEINTQNSILSRGSLVKLPAEIDVGRLQFGEQCIKLQTLQLQACPQVNYGYNQEVNHIRNSIMFRRECSIDFTCENKGNSAW